MINKEKVARKIHAVVNEDYNELRPMETNVLVRTAPKRISLPPNMMVFQTAAYLCATKLTASTNRVLMFFIALSAYENYIGIDVKTLMQELNMSKPTVVNSLKELELHKVLIKYQNTKDNRRHDYFINPVTAWKGNSYAREQQLKKIRKSDPRQLEIFDTVDLGKKEELKVNNNFDQEN